MLPIFKILFFWIVGILLIPYNPFTFMQLGSILVVLASLYLYAHFKTSFELKIIQNIVLIVFLIATVSFLHKSKALATKEVLKTDLEYTVVVKVKERYKQTLSLNKYIVELELFYDDSTLAIMQDFLLYQKLDSNLEQYFPGDRFQAKVYCTHLKEAKHEALFNSKQYWALKNIYAILWMQKEPVISLKPSSSIYYQIRSLQAKWVKLIKQQNISQDTQ